MTHQLLRPLRSIVVGAAAFALGAALAAQTSVPDIAFDANADLLKLPDNVHLGEAAGVATNSKGHIFVYTRTGAAHAAVGSSRTFYKSGSRLFEFDQTGKFVREIGVGVYGFNFAQAVHIDPQDNIWVVDQGSSNVIKFDADGRIQLVLSRKPVLVEPFGLLTLSRAGILRTRPIVRDCETGVFEIVVVEGLLEGVPSLRECLQTHYRLAEDLPPYRLLRPASYSATTRRPRSVSAASPFSRQQ